MPAAAKDASATEEAINTCACANAKRAATPIYACTPREAGDVVSARSTLKIMATMHAQHR